MSECSNNYLRKRSHSTIRSMGQDRCISDSVTKKLNIEESIPLSLGSKHHPHHLLCKSHTVEALARSNLDVLASIEKKVNQQAVFESINPALRSFFRGKTALVEAGIDALLTLITHNKSANSCSQADLFEHICERENVIKRVFISAKKIREAWKSGCIYSPSSRHLDNATR